MMSENLGHESCEHVLGDGKAKKSMDSCQSLWMAHWMQASRFKASQAHECSASHVDDKEQGSRIREGQTNIQIALSKKSKRLDIDEIAGDISRYKKIQRCGQDNLGVSTHLVQSGKQTLTHSTSVEIRNKLQIENSGNLTSTNEDAEQMDSEHNVRLPRHQMDKENYDVSCVSCFEKTRSEKQSLPKVDFGEGSGNTLPLHEDLAILDRNPSGEVIAVNSFNDSVEAGLGLGKSMPAQTHSQEEQLAQEKQLRSHDAPHEKNLSVRMVFQDDLTSSTSKSPTYEFKTTGMTSQTYTSQKDVDEPSLALACKEPDVSYLLKEHEQHSYHSSHVLLGSDEITKRLVARSDQNLCAQKKIDSLKPSDDPLIDDSHCSVIFGEKGRETAFRGLQPSHRSPQTIAATKDVVMLSSFCNVEMLQVSATVDSVKGVPGGPPKFSKTIHHPLTTKTTEVNLPERGYMVRDSTTPTKFEGSRSHEMIAIPSILYSQGKNKAKSEDLETSTYSEENGGGDAVKSGFLHLENESLFEADTMSLGINGHRNSLPGAISSTSDKVSAAGQNKENTSAIASINKEVRIRNMAIPDINKKLCAAGQNKENTSAIASINKEVRIRNMAIPDINKKLSPQLAIPSSVDEKGLSISRTESLGAEHLLSHDDQMDKSNFSPHHDTALGPEPSSLWIKRLMFRVAEPVALGTKCLRTCDPSSSGKVNVPLGRVKNCSQTSPELILSKHFDKMPQQSDKTVFLSRDRDSSLMRLLKKYPDLSASWPWIYRWQRHQKGTEKARPVPPVVLCEPESSKAADIRRKQFPSIAAMALMGKAVSNFRPCEFRKRGSIVVWNTEGYEKS